MIDALDVGYAIKDRRRELGLTQAQVAEASGVSKRCLWSLELGRNPGVQLDKLTAVLGALGLDLAIAPPADAQHAAVAHISQAEGAGAPGGTALNEKVAPTALPDRQKETTPSEPPQGDATSARDADKGFDALSILTGAAR